MRNESRITVFVFALMGILGFTSPALAHVELGTGNASLVGGDLADPEDDVVDRGSYGHDLSEAELRPEKGNWVEMKSFPSNPPGTPAHQRHAQKAVVG